MKLLVSPRSIEEAHQSLSADIIDVKKPSEGSLGANFPWVIRSIKSMTLKPVSAAIGDFDYKPGGAALAAYGAACAGADYIKIGLMFNGQDRAREVIQAVVRAVKEEYPEKFVVIAAYADYGRLGTISPMEISTLAAESGADVAMTDTGLKDGKSAFEFMDEATFIAFMEKNRELGLKTALAGGLRLDNIPALNRIRPDIVGIRGMVCGGDRNATIRGELVEKVKQMIR